MTFRRFAALAVVVAVMVALAPALSARSAAASTPPFRAYGSGLQSGQVVAASIGGAECGSTTVDATGSWLIDISADAPCGPHEGDTISFTVNGQATSTTGSWHSGGVPPNVATGFLLQTAPDTTPPVVTAPASIMVTVDQGATSAPATQSQIVAFLGAATAVDQVDGVLDMTNDAPATFPVGTTTVTFTATDKSGNSATASGSVTVKAAGPGTFAAPPADHGISLAKWNGGTVDQVVTAAGPGLNSVWMFSNGVAIGYSVGAPAFVNADFLAQFPNSEVPAGEIFFLVKE